jgi:hypothetical protein
LLGYGLGAVEVSDFSVITELPGQDDLPTNIDKAEG